MTYHFRTPEQVMTPLLHVRSSVGGRRKRRRGRVRAQPWKSIPMVAPISAWVAGAREDDTLLPSIMIAGAIILVKLSMLGLLIHSL